MKRYARQWSHIRAFWNGNYYGRAYYRCPFNYERLLRSMAFFRCRFYNGNTPYTPRRALAFKIQLRSTERYNPTYRRIELIHVNLVNCALENHCNNIIVVHEFGYG